MKLIRYIQSPAVCGLEYDEQRDLMEHPEKTSHYAKLIESRETKRRKKKKAGA